MSAYQNWTRAEAKVVIRQELLDPSGKWWSDAFLNLTIDQWQNELQQDYELVWGSATITTAINTLTLSSISPAMSRLEAVYFIGTSTGDRGYRLAGRLLQDLEVGNHEWRDAGADTPREIIQYDSTQMIVWPPLVQTGTFVFEYPRQLSFVDDTTVISLPPWSQWSVKPYVCAKAYLQPGPVNDLQKALKYKKMYDESKSRIKLLWDNWLPERYRRLKPAGGYEFDILHPPPAWSAPGGFLDIYRSYIPSGLVDGVNSVFVLPVDPTAVKVFVNGLLQTVSVGYTRVGGTITFIDVPESGADIVVWAFTQGG